jgi:Glutaredoxin-like domain (DUF836)
MTPASVPEIVLYERSGCHLCEDARAHLEELLATWSATGRPAPRLVGRDIDSEPAWHDAYFEAIPVVEIGERRLLLATSPARVRSFVEDALAEASADGARPVKQPAAPGLRPAAEHEPS